MIFESGIELGSVSHVIKGVETFNVMITECRDSVSI